MDRRLLQQHRPGAEDGRLRREREGRDDATTSRESHGRRQNSVNTNLMRTKCHSPSIHSRRAGETLAASFVSVSLGFTRLAPAASSRWRAARSRCTAPGRAPTPCPPEPREVHVRAGDHRLLRRVARAEPGARRGAAVAAAGMLSAPPAPGSWSHQPARHGGHVAPRAEAVPGPSRSSGACTRRARSNRSPRRTTRRATRRDAGPSPSPRRFPRHRNTRNTPGTSLRAGFSSRRARAVRPSPVHPRNRRRAAPRSSGGTPRAPRARRASRAARRRAPPAGARAPCVSA